MHAGECDSAWWGTAVLPMSDRGHTRSAHIESYALPCAWLWVPRHAGHIGYEQRQHLQHNSGAIVAALDLHYTVRHVTGLSGDRCAGACACHGNGTSLLCVSHDENRTCDDAGVRADMCPCDLDAWEPVTTISDSTWRWVRRVVHPIVY